MTANYVVLHTNLVLAFIIGHPASINAAARAKYYNTKPPWCIYVFIAQEWDFII